ncbi:hypothetical protein FF38_10149 [Lucilia cuprina]|uniref:Uncharacterized protein n=1 Tax=Lucilia cuprina TaxID=7375 RepID=A0A0L0C9X8_LUCCU|nr:hypothetical protein FF38_10149 [Lucilia cuprina]
MSSLLLLLLQLDVIPSGKNFGTNLKVVKSGYDDLSFAVKRRNVFSILCRWFLLTVPSSSNSFKMVFLESSLLYEVGYYSEALKLYFFRRISLFFHNDVGCSVKFTSETCYLSCEPITLMVLQSGVIEVQQHGNSPRLLTSSQPRLEGREVIYCLISELILSRATETGLPHFIVSVSFSNPGV